MNFPELDFKRLAKHEWVEDINRIIETHFLNIGIEYAKLFSNNKAEFKRLFTERKSFRETCVWIYWSYRQHKLCEEVKPEPGESSARLIGRKILEVFKVITQ